MRFVFHLSALAALCGGVQAKTLDCDPCIERSNYKISAIYHGAKSDPFWQQIESAAIQSGKDLGVELDTMLFDEYDPEAMAAQIRSAIQQWPDALIVTIPTDGVADAVAEAITAGIPVFGCNAGYDRFKALGGKGWVAQDETMAGETAGELITEMFLDSDMANMTVGFIGPGASDAVFAARLAGLTTGLADVGIEPVPIAFDQSLTPEELLPVLETAFEGCPFDLVMLQYGNRVGVIKEMINCPDTLFAAFDENWSEVTDGDLAFVFSQQQYLQGVLPVLLASSFVTTGSVPAIPLDNINGVFLTGPKVIDIDNLPSADEQACILDAFPVCPATGANGCPCTDRSAIKIGGSLHGITTDDFWNPVYAAAEQSAKDMGVTLDNGRFAPVNGDNSVLFFKMNAKISELCSEGVDGILVTIPSELVFPGVQQCKDAGIPVIAINAGAEVVADMGLLHYIGQLEYNAGFSAALELVKKGMTKGWCLNHAPEVQTTIQRCKGMEDALADSDAAEYMGSVEVPADNDAQYKVDVTAAVDDNGLWGGFGFMLTGQIQVPPCIQLLDEHPSALIGSFDLGGELFDALDENQVVYGIDQQPYVQGYFPVPLLTYFAQSGQSLLNGVVESGPSFVFESPDAAELACQANNNKVCSADMETDPPESSSTDDTEKTDPPDDSPAAQATTVLSMLAILPLLLA